ncbi:MAG: SUMF1/EgtB/PvdO family nonheme iron enzyme [Alteromonas sp.]|nr:SUMF1/EgtB/PvdO family nonheme iron enzyme [Alteromonas sp.]
MLNVNGNFNHNIDKGKREKTAKRVLRGGSWNNNAHNCRSANRNHNHADNANNNIGLRVTQLLF